LFERELFGYEKGAFSEAGALNRGKLEMAHGGILLLEEITELSERLQTQLLRFLQDGAFNRVGGGQPLQVDVRIIATTSLEADEDGRPHLAPEDEFCWDLFARLNPAQLRIPPLRERPEDILALAEYFLRRYNRDRTQPILGLKESARQALCDYAWPGNVRELANCLERALMLCKDQVISAEDLPMLDRSAAAESAGHYFTAEQGGHLLPLKEVERRHIKAALERFGWNQVKAAAALHIHRNTLRRKIQEYELNPH
jgi:DNA-binding NtrC family response regulator